MRAANGTYQISFFYGRKYTYDEDGIRLPGKGVPVGTTARVLTPKGAELEGESWCNEAYDNPVKEVGRKIALTRAIQDLPVEERRKVWITYFSRGRALGENEPA